jgi:hypothetical protein
MSLKTVAQANLASLITRYPEAVRTVVAGSNTASGFASNRATDASLGDSGEIGITTSVVYCNAATIGTLVQGQTITVDGSAATVTRVVVDPLGALTRVEYQLQRPVSGI